LVDIIVSEGSVFQTKKNIGKTYNLGLLASHILMEILGRVTVKTSESQAKILQPLLVKDDVVDSLRELFNEEEIFSNEDDVTSEPTIHLPSGLTLEFYENLSVILALLHPYKMVPDDLDVIRCFLLNLLEMFVNTLPKKSNPHNSRTPCELYYSNFTLLPVKRVYLTLCAYVCISLEDNNFYMLDFTKTLPFFVKIIQSPVVYEGRIMFAISVYFFYHYLFIICCSGNESSSSSSSTPSYNLFSYECAERIFILLGNISVTSIVARKKKFLEHVFFNFF
jgi:hypothetical protein